MQKSALAVAAQHEKVRELRLAVAVQRRQVRIFALVVAARREQMRIFSTLVRRNGKFEILLKCHTEAQARDQRVLKIPSSSFAQS